MSLPEFHSPMTEVPATVAVFSPTPLLTVAIEARSDAQSELHIHAGGQGFWVARMIARLGVPVMLCAQLGGDTGRLRKTLIADGTRARMQYRHCGVNGC
jgi:1-phosphofructokinase